MDRFSQHHKILANLVAIEDLVIGRSLDVRETPAAKIIVDMNPTHNRMHGRQDGSLLSRKGGIRSVLWACECCASSARLRGGTSHLAGQLAQAFLSDEHSRGDDDRTRVFRAGSLSAIVVVSSRAIGLLVANSEPPASPFGAIPRPLHIPGHYIHVCLNTQPRTGVPETALVDAQAEVKSKDSGPTVPTFRKPLDTTT